MKWNNKNLKLLDWNNEISNKEEKLIVAEKIAQKVSDGDVIGFGSGSTSFLAIKEIAKRIHKENLICKGIPTSPEIAFACSALEIPTTSLIQDKPDWCFDGADEVDLSNNLIKGRGGALLLEKIIMSASPKAFILVDRTKLVDKLSTRFPIPVEINSQAIHQVTEELIKLGAINTSLRLAKEKDGPVITEAGNYLLDVKFSSMRNTLEKEIKCITGVVESGLFIGYNVEILKP